MSLETGKSGAAPMRMGLAPDESLRLILNHRHSGTAGDGQAIPGGFLNLTGSFIVSPDGVKHYLHSNNAGVITTSLTP